VSSAHPQTAPLERAVVGGASPLVRVRGLTKAYGEGRAERRVLDNADLDVGAGELVAVVGRSGTGKSTLLHLLGGLDRPDAGAIAVAGVPVDSAGERALTDLRRRRLGFVFQFFHLVPELSGADNVLLPTRLLAEGNGRARARALIDRLGLGDVADHLPHTLSGGEQQRFAIARALVNDPVLVLADEPTGNLDAVAGTEVLRLLRAAAQGPRSVVMVTHDPEAAALADRVLRLDEGRLVP
jgi:ABC-type lipoprotein export system ATPase subunit